MKLFVLFSLAILALVVFATEIRASSSQVSDDVTFSELAPGDDTENEEEEEHLRIKRSPGWRRRFRFRKPIRKIGSAVRRAASKARQAVRKVGKKVKAGVKKIASKTKQLVKKTGEKLKSGAKKIHRKTKSALQKATEKAKSIGKFPKKFIKKLKEKVASKILKKNVESEVESSVTPTKPSCDEVCEFLKKASKVVDFFKKTFCAFYTVKRTHTDFLLDRNLNATLAFLMNDIAIDSVNFFTDMSNAIRMLDPSRKMENRQTSSQECASGKIMPCSSKGLTANDEIYQLKCLKPCHGFTGCVTSDNVLRKTVDKAIAKYQKEVQSALKLLE